MPFIRGIAASVRLVSSLNRALVTSSRLRISAPTVLPVTQLQRGLGRAFSTSVVRTHGHITPPKPGEEYVFPMGLVLWVVG